MKIYTLIAGVNGVGKSSLRGVLEGQGVMLGNIIDPDAIALKYGAGGLKAGGQAIREIEKCFTSDASFTQESTLSGHYIEHNLKRAKKQGYYISLIYVGLNSLEDSITRISNRVRKGGHDIPVRDVERRYKNRFRALQKMYPYFDEITFYDNDNGFVKVAEVRDRVFRCTNGYRPAWIMELARELGFGT